MSLKPWEVRVGHGGVVPPCEVRGARALRLTCQGHGPAAWNIGICRAFRMRFACVLHVFPPRIGRFLKGLELTLGCPVHSRVPAKVGRSGHRGDGQAAGLGRDLFGPREDVPWPSK